MQGFNSKQIYFLFSFFGLVIVILYYIVSYLQLGGNLETRFLQSAQKQLNFHEAMIKSRIEHYHREVQTLAKSPLFSECIQGYQKKHPDLIKKAHEYLLDRAKSHDDMMQIRYIDNNGQEQLRVERHDIAAPPFIISDKKLQNKKKRYYVKEIAQLPQGAVLYTPIDLNIEHGKIVRPLQPTMRIGTPLFINGKRSGMLVINIFMQKFLRQFQDSAMYHLYMTDARGNFILHTNTIYNWSRELGKKHTLHDEMPEVASAILASESFSNDHLFSKRLFFAPSSQYFLVAQLNTALINSQKSELNREFMLIALIVILISLPFGLSIARRFELLSSRLRAIINSLGDGLFILDKNEKTSYVNNKAVELLEYSSAELLNRRNHKLLQHGDSEGNYIDEEDCPIHHSNQTMQQVHRDDNTFVTKSGRLIHVEYTTTPLLVHNSYEGSITLFKDITSRKLLEADLKNVTQSLRNERNLFVTGPVIVFTWKNEDNWPVHYVSPNVADLFGYSDLTFIEGSVSYPEVIHPEDIERVTKEVEKAITDNKETLIHQPYRIISKEGHIHWVYDKTTIVREESGESIQLHGYIIDITEQKELEEGLKHSESKYRHLVENTVTGVFQIDETGKLLYANEALLNILDCEEPDHIYDDGNNYIFRRIKDRDTFVTTLKNEEKVDSYEFLLRTHKEKTKNVVISAQYLDGIISGMMIDMSDVVIAEKEIEKLSKVIEQIDDIVTITDTTGVITYVNQAFSRFTGYSKEDAIGRTPRLYKSDKHSKLDMQKLWETILEGNVYRGVIINKKKSGELFYEEKTITPLTNEYGTTIAYVSTGKDITDRVEMEIKLERLASTDYLTGLYNRFKFEELFEKESNRSHRYEVPLSLIMFDIDYFKKINDTYGHDIGDLALKELTKLVASHIRQSDVFARWGGEEFMLLTPEIDKDAAFMLAEKLRKAISKFAFTEVGHINCSFGVVELQQEDTFNTLSQRVDKALYQAKEGGRNRTEIL